jgi:hypothetical protein
VAENTNKIKQHIDSEREQLGRNLDEIQYRVKRATDFKDHFNRNTAWVLGGAVAGGFLLSLAFRGGSSSTSTSRSRTTRSMPAPLERISGTLDTIFEGLSAVVAAKLLSFVADNIPGFRQQYDAIERQRGRGTVSDFSSVR